MLRKVKNQKLKLKNIYIYSLGTKGNTPNEKESCKFKEN